MKLARIRLAASLVASLILASCEVQAPTPATRDAAMLRIDTVVVIYAENHSFDNLPRRRRHCQRNARASDADRSRRHTAERADHLRQRRPARPELPAHAEQAVSHRRAAGQPHARPAGAEPDPCVLPSSGADQRRQEQHVRRDVAGRRLDDGLLRRLGVSPLAMGPRLHACRPLLHGRVRRLVPEPPVPDLRLRGSASERARAHARRARCGRQADEKARVAFSEHRCGASRQQRRRSGDVRRPVGQHVAAAVPAERHPAG